MEGSLIYDAWGLIANADPAWQQAAERWRVRYRESLRENIHPTREKGSGN